MSEKMFEKAFWGQRETTYWQARTEVLRAFFHKHALSPVVLAGQVANHLRCGLLESEKLLEHMVADRTLRYASKEEAFHAGVSFGYVAAEALSAAS